ncbi:TadE/TadG family type IV pilus assembly protein [Ottowia sp. VDI28]|uniref:TadE/TadG family type IV pilus assembly protein n=1 Tax=Ottowia sp. VDI28 TaxID=3133968 RepID=UPI003C2B1C57
MRYLASSISFSLRRGKQRGMAALEFSLLVLFVIIPVFLGVFVFWEVLQTQQVVTRAAGDGAREAYRLLQSARTPNADGSYPTDAQAISAAETRVRESVSAALRNHLGGSADMDNLITVTLAPFEANQLALSVSYARPALLGTGGLNFIEPETLEARSLISWH